jgi:hypothetical protein
MDSPSYSPAVRMCLPAPPRCQAKAGDIERHGSFVHPFACVILLCTDPIMCFGAARDAGWTHSPRTTVVIAGHVLRGDLTACVLRSCATDPTRAVSRGHLEPASIRMFSRTPIRTEVECWISNASIPFHFHSCVPCRYMRAITHTKATMDMSVRSGASRRPDRRRS